MSLGKIINSYEDEFQELKEKLKNAEENNIFKILNLQNYEIRHSRYLAWLLDPNQPHGLGTTFLEKLFEKLGVKDESMSFNHIEVYTEYPVPTDENYNKKGYIDILIEADDFVCVIENKYGSKEHDEQCKRYKNFVEDKFEGKKHIFIYLDIYEPDKKLFENEGTLYKYLPITYKELLKILPKSLYDNKNSNEINTTNNQILEYYKQILREKYNVLGNDGVSQAIKKFLKIDGAIETLLNECEEDKDNIEECNTVWTIQSYMWATCLKKANELIRGIYDELKLKPKGDDWEYIDGNYGVYRGIPERYSAPQDIFISISNNLAIKDFESDGINVFIVKNSENKWEKIYGINLIRKEVFFNKVLKNDGEEILDNYIEEINNIIKEYDQIINKKQNLKSMT